MSRRGRPRRGMSVLSEVAQPAGKVPRRKRVEGEVLQELSEALRKLQDPRLAAAGITSVRLSDDLRYARVLVRLSFGDDAPEARSAMLKALEAASGRLRSHVGRTLELRYTPALRFVYDEGPDAAQRVEELLAEIRAERGEE